ncbi:MAG: response regulator [Candidatus Omnitrophica bacterium]|nr:response regulator [Candidatus Omnitrophota bacterium]MDD5670152.1 response regulator [Candidatus Omnitrophota bacterium]
MSKKILLVDDEPEIRTLLTIRLSAYGYQVLTAENGVEAILKIKSEKPDLVILDILMPGLTGYQVVDEIRKLDSDIRNVPIIIISAKHKMRDLFDPADIHCFLPKPFDPKELTSKIESALNDKDALRFAAQPNTLPSGKGQRILLAGTEEYILGKIKQHLESLKFFVQIVNDENDLIQSAARLFPRAILCQYWETSDRFDSEKIYRDLHQKENTKYIPFFFFCPNILTMDAMKVAAAKNIIGYRESTDLLYKIDDCLRQIEGLK